MPGTLSATVAQAGSAAAALAGSGALSATAALGSSVAAALSGAGSLTATTFIALSETNIARTNQPVPAGTSGCYVTLIGGGGGGGCGSTTSVVGSGGGGGAQVARTWVPVRFAAATEDRRGAVALVRIEASDGAECLGIRLSAREPMRAERS